MDPVLLRVQPQARLALAVGRDAVVGNMICI